MCPLPPPNEVMICACVLPPVHLIESAHYILCWVTKKLLLITSNVLKVMLIWLTTNPRLTHGQGLTIQLLDIKIMGFSLSTSAIWGMPSAALAAPIWACRLSSLERKYSCLTDNSMPTNENRHLCSCMVFHYYCHVLCEKKKKDCPINLLVVSFTRRLILQYCKFYKNNQGCELKSLVQVPAVPTLPAYLIQLYIQHETAMYIIIQFFTPNNAPGLSSYPSLCPL